MSGYAAAVVAVLIWASYPVATRAGVTGAFAPEDLMLLRFGVGALLFLPFLAARCRAIRREAWLRGVPLTLFQGAGMAALVIFGLQFAPASHAAALGPGFAPAWVALLGYLVFSRRPSARMVVGAAFSTLGVLALAAGTAFTEDRSVLLGDAMFLAASALGALYVLQMRDWGINAVQAAGVDVAANDKINDLHRAILSIVKRDGALTAAATDGDVHGFTPLPKPAHPAGQGGGAMAQNDHGGHHNDVALAAVDALAVAPADHSHLWG